MRLAIAEVRFWVTLKRRPRSLRVTKTEEEWKKELTPEQFDVLRKHGTERAGTSRSIQKKRAGTYACAGCDLPLFSSETKFDSGTGWPSFWKPIDNAVATTTDTQLVHDAHRSSLPAMRRPSRPRLRRRAEADGPALLHERRGAEVHSEGGWLISSNFRSTARFMGRRAISRRLLHSWVASWSPSARRRELRGSRPSTG